jgi:hypothetical protein
VWASDSKEDGAEDCNTGKVAAIYLSNASWWSSLDFPRFDSCRLHRAPDFADEAPRWRLLEISSKSGLSKPSLREIIKIGSMASDLVSSFSESKDRSSKTL